MTEYHVWASTPSRRIGDRSNGSDRSATPGVYATQLLPFYDARAVALFEAFESAIYEMA